MREIPDFKELTDEQIDAVIEKAQLDLALARQFQFGPDTMEESMLRVVISMAHMERAFRGFRGRPPNDKNWIKRLNWRPRE